MENFRSPQEQQPIQLQLYELFVKDTKKDYTTGYWHGTYWSDYHSGRPFKSYVV